MKRKVEPWRVRCCANCKHWKAHGMHGFRWVCEKGMPEEKVFNDTVCARHRFKDR